MTALHIATSPRSTWITAPSVEAAAEVKRLLADRWYEVRRRGRLDPLAVDVSIGSEAYEAGHLLLDAGYTFAWHDDQHELDRADTAWGIPVADS